MTPVVWTRWAFHLATLALPVTLVAQQPAGPWRQYADPAQAGFSKAALESVRRYADSAGVAAVMIVQSGRVVVAWGDVARPFQCHSVRKSFLSALYGIGVAEGRIALGATLAELDIDDHRGLTPQEKSATVRDLLKARSGVYHPSAYSPESMERNLPARGSHPPGSFWYYNNWDFNTLGTIYEQRAGQDIFDDFRRLIAEPIGMEDYRVDLNADILEPSKSRHAAYTFRMSTRDLARFGQLFLQRGRWGDRQVVPAAWVDESTASHSEVNPGGYGYMWWVYPRWTLGADSRWDGYAARGSGGQVLYVIPALELVIVIRGDTDNGNGVSGVAVGELLRRIPLARTGKPAARPRLAGLTQLPLPNVRPAPDLPRAVALDPAVYRQYVGEYELQPGTRARAFLYEGRLFMDFPGRGEGELFPLSSTRFFLKVVPNVRIEFVRDAGGRVEAAKVNLGRGDMVLRRVPS